MQSHWHPGPLTFATLVVVSASLIRWADLHWGFAWVRESLPLNWGVLAAATTELIALLWYVLPVAGVTCLLHGPRKVWRELGLYGHVRKALSYAFMCTLPMLLGYAWTGQRVEEAAVPLLVLAQFRAAFREEVFYRAFLFGQLFRHGQWGFIPAVGLNALIFAFSHLYQASTPLQGVVIFGVTFIGAVWFAWLYVAWQYQVWAVVGLHFFMNLWWELFRMGEAAFSGALWAEVPRLLTIAISITWILLIVRRQKVQVLSPNSLWWPPRK